VVCGLAALPGCAPSEISNFLLFTGQGPAGERTIAGNLETVAEATQSSLLKMGIVAMRSDRDGAVYLTGATRTNARFTLILTRERTPTGEATHARVQWPDERDPEGHEQILANVVSQKRQDGR
jgi:hypothetical protein